MALLGVAGLTTGSLEVPPEVIVQQYFQKRRPLAASVTSMGYSFGGILGAPLLRLSVDFYGWRGAFLTLAAITMQSMVAVMLLAPNPDLSVPRSGSSMVHSNQRDYESQRQKKIDDCSKASTQPIGEMQMLPNRKQRPKCSEAIWRVINVMQTDFRFFHNYLFIIYFISAAPGIIGLTVFYSYGIQRAIDQGVDKVGASFIPSAIGLASMTGRLVSGCVANAACTNRAVQFSVLVLLGGLVVGGSALAGHSLALHLTFAGLFGLCLGNTHGTMHC